MTKHPVETYLTHLREIRDTGGGTAEESYYGPLEALFNEAGGRLKPRVRAVQQLKNRGSGEPDFGFYTADQFQGRDEAPIAGLGPERGAAEVKPWRDDLAAVAAGEQVARYLRGYRLVLVTNYREFVLMALDELGRVGPLESFRLAETPAAFLDQLAHPRRAAEQHGDRLLDFLRRALLLRAPLSDPQDLAFFLASYAREARARLEDAADLRALRTLKEALEGALGMRFEGERGEHFFRATLVQTLFYGVFSSWVLWCRDLPDGPDGRFDWHNAAWTLHVPMIRDLFDQIATPNRLKSLGIDQTLDWAGAALNRVDRAAFFRRFEEEQAVQYFYEPFLRAYDPALRKELGVWYTPPEIVRYQVERVDGVLRDELGLADGLADERVVVLDPCCGTGAYLVEVLRRVHATLSEQGAGALLAQRLKRAATGRVFGFELLPAPFVVAHLQLGLLLRGLGAPLADENERAGVYLTNSLTGWEPPDAQRARLPFPELEAERDAAERVKQQKRILVILGNPPYNAFAGVSPEEEGELVEAYKAGLNKPVAQGGWGIKKFNLDDLYVRFFRIAEKRIVLSGEGVICYISNFSYLGDPSFVVMRQRLLGEFDRLWFDCLNGDSRETGKLTPEGLPDPSVFSTAQNREGIRVGTAVGLFVRRARREGRPVVRFRHFWGATKRADLLASLDAPDFDAAYQTAAPDATNRYSFRPSEVSGAYLSWPLLHELAKQVPAYGHMETRGLTLISHDRLPLLKRMEAYFDPNISNEKMAEISPSLMARYSRYDGMQDRSRILKDATYSESKVGRLQFKPFDIRYAYLDTFRPLWSEPSGELTKQTWEGNSFIVSRVSGVKPDEGAPVYFQRYAFERDVITGHARAIPWWIRSAKPLSSKMGMLSLFGDEPTTTANLSPAARAYLGALGLPNPDDDAATAALVWLHALATGYSPAYLSDNADGIRQDWPRLPLPASADALRASAALGAQVAALLDTEQPVPGVTSGRIRSELRGLGEIRRAGGGQLDPAQGHLDLTAGWGHAGKGGVTMPGRGKLGIRNDESGIGNEEPAAGGASALAPGPWNLAPSYDIYLNDHAYWANVPAAVWEYTIGGYQVIKKWLSYREKALLGRGLTLDEVEHVTQMARRLAALVALAAELDDNYRRAAGEAWVWPAAGLVRI